MKFTHSRFSLRLILIPLILAACAALQGCFGIVAGAAGGTAMAVYDRRDAEVILKDETIESVATDKLYSDVKLQKKIHINVTCYNQVVLLTGEVLSRAALEHAVDQVGS